jgi:protein TonB
VTLRVHITARGVPDQVRINTSSGSPRLDESALNTVSRTWRFVPAKRNCVSIQSWALVPIGFRLE